MNRGFLRTKFQAYTLICFENTDNLKWLYGPDSFRGFRETGLRLVKDSELEENVKPRLGELTATFASVVMSGIQEDQIYEQLLKTYFSFEPDRDTVESQPTYETV